MKKNPFLPNYLVTGILAFLTILSAQNVAGTVIFQDAIFNNSDWSSVLIPNSVTGSSFTAAQNTSNGFPAPSRLTTHIYPKGTIYVAHRYRLSTPYNPAIQGAIANLSYSYHLNHLTPLKVAYSLMVFQNGTYYHRLPGDLITGPVWTPFGAPNLTAASFTKLWGPSSNVNPDFSCTGAPIVFGYITRNTNTILGTTDTTKSGLDNWRVRINETPCCVARPPGMRGWWQFEELNGATVVTDIAGFNNAGIPKPGPALGQQNGPNSVTGEVNKALYFVGPYLEVAPHPELNFGLGSFSIDAWVKPVACGHGPGAGFFSAIAEKFNGSSSGFSFYLDQPAVGVARLYLRINSSPAFVSSGTIPAVGSGTWSHVAVTVARPAMVGTFYINGVQAGNFTPPAGSVNNALPMWIGKTRIPGGICENAIDELELFNRALLPTEVRSIADAKSKGKCP